MPSTNTERQAALSAARADAIKDLIASNQEEFNTLMTRHAEARGETWAPRKSEKEKAAEALASILAAHPDLAALVK